jgi:hypothetical protein
LTALILQNEALISGSFFLGILIIVGLREILAPRRPLNYSKYIRWYSNFGIVLINNLIIRVLFPVLATGLAAMCYEKGWGLLNYQYLPIPAERRT